MTFKEFLNESLDSFVDITKKEKDGNLEFYYFSINDKEFRIVLEVEDFGTAIIFEQKINNNYTYEGIQSNLSSKEVLTLFGTLKKQIINNIKTEKNYIYTDDKQKLRIYLKLLSKVGAKSIKYNEDNIPYEIGFSFNNNADKLNMGFKFKFWRIK